MSYFNLIESQSRYNWMFTLQNRSYNIKCYLIKIIRSALKCDNYLEQTFNTVIKMSHNFLGIRYSLYIMHAIY
jgi:hypothetical protein